MVCKRSQGRVKSWNGDGRKCLGVTKKWLEKEVNFDDYFKGYVFK